MLNPSEILELTCLRDMLRIDQLSAFPGTACQNCGMLATWLTHIERTDEMPDGVQLFTCEAEVCVGEAKKALPKGKSEALQRGDMALRRRFNHLMQKAQDPA